MKFRKVLAAVAAAVVGATGVVANTPAAEAQQRNVVLFGDSLLANPPHGFVDFVNPGFTTGVTLAEHSSCPKGIDRVGVELERRHGAHVSDFSCSGAATFGMLNNHSPLAMQVDEALQSQQLNPGTTNVHLQIGLNDNFKGFGIYAHQKQSYRDYVGHQIDRIRHAAPNARIQILGYPEMLGMNDFVCPVHFNQVELSFPFAPLGNSLRAVTDWQKTVAADKNVEYFDLNRASHGHGQCAPKEQRWVSGFLDNQSDPYNMTFHYTHEGNRHIADIIAGTW